MSNDSTILRVDKKAGRWEAIPVALITDDRLAFDTRGFAVWLISKPDGWEIRAAALPYLLKDCTATRGHVGRDKARRFLRELERGGYLVRTRTRGSNGRWLWRSVFTATSLTIDALAVDGSSVDGSTADGKGVDLYQTDNYIKRNHSIPNHPTARAAQDVVASTEGTAFPAVLTGTYRASARALIGACPLEQRQAVLDEVAALHERSAIRGSPIGLLHRLVERANQGTFTPSQGIRYRNQSRKELPDNPDPSDRRSRSPEGAPEHISRAANSVLSAIRVKRKSSGSV
jgi:hypothetical protein